MLTQTICLRSKGQTNMSKDVNTSVIIKLYVSMRITVFYYNIDEY